MHLLVNGIKTPATADGDYFTALVEGFPHQTAHERKVGGIGFVSVTLPYLHRVHHTRPALIEE